MINSGIKRYAIGSGLVFGLFVAGTVADAATNCGDVLYKPIKKCVEYVRHRHPGHKAASHVLHRHLAPVPHHAAEVPCTPSVNTSAGRPIVQGMEGVIPQTPALLDSSSPTNSPTSFTTAPGYSSSGGAYGGGGYVATGSGASSGGFPPGATGTGGSAAPGAPGTTSGGTGSSTTGGGSASGGTPVSPVSPVSGGPIPTPPPAAATVPNPPVWMMLVVGFGAVGIITRQRHTRAA